MTDVLTAHAALADWSARLPDRDFLLQPEDRALRRMSFSEAEDASRRMATALLDLGLGPGDKVAILSKNCAEWLLADFAIAMAGLISIPIYPTARRRPSSSASWTTRTRLRALFPERSRP